MFLVSPLPHTLPVAPVAPIASVAIEAIAIYIMQRNAISVSRHVNGVARQVVPYACIIVSASESVNARSFFLSVEDLKHGVARTSSGSEAK